VTKSIMLFCLVLTLISALTSVLPILGISKVGDMATEEVPAYFLPCSCWLCDRRSSNSPEKALVVNNRSHYRLYSHGRVL